MTASAIWFFLLLASALGLVALGSWLGGKGRTVRAAALAASLLLVGLAMIPKFHPALLYTTLPLGVAVHLEGLLGTFPWMVLVGLLWAGRFTDNLRRAARLMVILGIVYFLFGGVWMVLPNIRPEYDETRTAQGLTLQGRPDTCVPSACATALRRLGVETDEAEMCRVTMARPGRGSTLGRAAWGLRRFLEPRGIGVSVVALDANEVIHVARPDRPILVVIRSNVTADHMVVVLERLGSGVLIANPSPGEHGGVTPMPYDLPVGYELYEGEDFAKLYRGAAIVFGDGAMSDER